jgi:hypothetical protein
VALHILLLFSASGTGILHHGRPGCNPGTRSEPARPAGMPSVLRWFGTVDSEEKAMRVLVLS